MGIFRKQRFHFCSFHSKLGVGGSTPPPLFGIMIPRLGGEGRAFPLLFGISFHSKLGVGGSTPPPLIWNHDSKTRGGEGRPLPPYLESAFIPN